MLLYLLDSYIGMPKEIDGNTFDELREIVLSNIEEMSSGEYEVDVDNPYIVVRRDRPFPDSESGTLSKITRGATVDGTEFTASFPDVTKEDGDIVYRMLLKEQPEYEL